MCISLRKDHVHILIALALTAHLWLYTKDFAPLENCLIAIDETKEQSIYL